MPFNCVDGWNFSANGYKWAKWITRIELSDLHPLGRAVVRFYNK